MAFTESEEERGNVKIVSSKLPREDFAIFKKLCDIEDKSPSRKIRELITKEVNDKFGDIYKSRYEKEKIAQFQRSAIKDYNDSQIISEICKVNFVERTDERFIQIGIRPVINEDIFLRDKNGVHVHPELPSIGMHIAIGERDFLIRNILDNKEIERIKIDREELKEFPKYAFEFNQGTILISLDYFVELSQKLMRRIEYKNSKTILDTRYRLIFVPGEMMKNKVIIIEKDAILWARQKFHNEFTGKDEGLDIYIEPKVGEKVDITLRSVNRIKALDLERIKILEVEKDE
jgi:hypothetical protein